MTPFPAGPFRIGKDWHGAVAQRQRIPFATGRSRVRIPPAPPDGSSRGAPDKAPVRTDSHHALEKAMGGTVKAPMAQWQRGRLVSGRSPVRIRLGALGRRPRAWPSGGPGGQARGVMDASPCVGGAMASTAVSKTVDPGSSPGRRANGMWRSRQRARLGAARPRVRVPPFRRGRTRQDRACRRAPPQTAWRGLTSPRKPSAPRLRGGACMTPPRTRGLRPGPWATPPLSGMPEVPAAAVQGPAMRRGGRMRTPDTKGAHHV